MREPMRRVRFAPYRKGCGPTFSLTLYDLGGTGLDHRRRQIGYRLTMSEGGKRKTLFEGSDFGPSPLHADDSDASVAALMGFLTLRRGDMDPDFFEDDTPDITEYREQHAEALAGEVMSRFGEDT